MCKYVGLIHRGIFFLANPNQWVPSHGCRNSQSACTGMDQSQTGRRSSAETPNCLHQDLSNAALSHVALPLWSLRAQILTPHITAYIHALASQESALITNQRAITTRKKLTKANMKPRFNRNIAPHIPFHQKRCRDLYFPESPAAICKHLARWSRLLMSE